MVCPALLPPWLRTITSALLVSTSMIFPFPSSPHCAPTKIVFAISIQNSGKKFSRRIWQDAVGTCRRMIRTARLRASGFQARAISQKNDQPPQRLRRKVDAHYFTPHPDSVVDRSFARVAIQHRLGLLSKRRARIDPFDPDHSRPNGTTLIWIKSSSERSGSSTRPLSSAHRPIPLIRPR